MSLGNISKSVSFSMERTCGAGGHSRTGRLSQRIPTTNYRYLFLKTEKEKNREVRFHSDVPDTTKIMMLN